MLKRWMLLSAIGYGVLFSLALVGLVRISLALVGLTLADSAAGNLFLVSSLIAGGVAAFMYGRSLPATPRGG
jgi:hypothetical protein